MTQEPATAVSKRALKRQAKVTSSDGSTVDKTAEGSTTPHAEASLNGYDESNAYASPHLKELHRSLRNIKKKLVSPLITLPHISRQLLIHYSDFICSN